MTRDCASCRFRGTHTTTEPDSKHMVTTTVCRRGPPYKDTHLRGAWPAVASNDTCGEHRFIEHDPRTL